MTDLVTRYERYDALTREHWIAMKATLGALSVDTRGSMKHLRVAERNHADGRLFHTTNLLQAAAILLSNGMSRSLVSRIVGHSAEAALTEIFHEREPPEEPNRGGRPKATWLTFQQEEELLESYDAQVRKGISRPIEPAIRAWSKAFAIKEDYNRVRDKLYSLIKQRKSEDERSIADFEEVNDHNSF